jgi:type I restriction enzyme, S subunit
MTQYPLVKFGDVVRQVKDKVDPQTAGLERFVAGEHMDTDNLHIRRWGDVGAGYLGPAFHMRFKPGQVLYGSRRTYLRKVAFAEFEGITANTTYVIESKDPEVLLPEFLPFIMQTDSFNEHSIKQSKGSVNPYINFSDITWYEFPLPPMDEQRRIADLLWAAEDSMTAYQDVLEKTQSLKESVAYEAITTGLGLARNDRDLKNSNPLDGWKLITGQELLSSGYLFALQDGNHGGEYPKAAELGNQGYPYIAASDIDEDGTIDLVNCRRILPERANRLRIPPAQSGDVILTNNATIGRVTRLPEWNTPIVASTSTTYYRCNEEMLKPNYLRLYFESEVFQAQLRSIMRQSTRNQVPITTQKRLLFVVPPIEKQEELSNIGSELVSTRQLLKNHLLKTRDVKNKILQSMDK